jgi:hypothetical protein
LIRATIAGNVARRLPEEDTAMGSRAVEKKGKKNEGTLKNERGVG